MLSKRLLLKHFKDADINGIKNPFLNKPGLQIRTNGKKNAVLVYNREDVVNLVKLALKIFRKFKIKDKYLDSIKLK